MDTKRVTAYLRDSIVTQINQQINISEKAIKVDFDCFGKAEIPVEMADQLFKQKNQKNQTVTGTDMNSEVDADTEKDKDNTGLKVIIAMQVVNIKVGSGVKLNSAIEDLTSTLLVPANLDKSGKLSVPTDGGLPWIPRDYLSPQIDNFLVVGEVADINSFIESKTYEIKKIKETGHWQDYISFVEQFWTAVNKTALFDKQINNYVGSNQPFVLDDNIYVLIDDTINSTTHIKALYDYICTNIQVNKLYENMTSLDEKANRPLIENKLLQMKEHSGQMSEKFPLSPSQRESINHFFALEEGDVLAVNGPPGTGKTTLLQSIIADMMVKHALEKKDAPIIVASSTNNQAVTNIIDSFASAGKSKHQKQLDSHWITNKTSFAMYFPSKNKVDDAKARKHQYTSTKMDYSVEEIETESNIKLSIDNVVKKCADLFKKDTLNLEECGLLIHSTLKNFDEGRKKILDLVSQLTIELQISNGNTEHDIEIFEAKLQEYKVKDLAYNKRRDEWCKYWNQLWLYRFFKFIPAINNKLKNKLNEYLNDDEVFNDDHFNISDIEKLYNEKIKTNLETSRNYKIGVEILEISKLFQSIDVNIFETKKSEVKLSLDVLNLLFDANIRYYEFWLSVHYYECRWLMMEHKVDKENLSKNTEKLMIDKYKRLSMITPCFVMTLFMLPTNFKLFPLKYLVNFIDLLIIDEAGQVSPEIGLASFLLAKKALVVGDIYQIEPVWNVSRSVDLALTIQHEIGNLETFTSLVDQGISSSESSLMKSANKACDYAKYGNKGLLLTEHRRCYDELIDYCNDLVYDGKLEPLRGKATLDGDYPFGKESSLTHIHVDTEYAERYASSRRNKAEAEAIKMWLDSNYNLVKNAYPGESEENLIGIITPFKAQAMHIKSTIKNYPQVSVGTVHAFQGGERRVILFSTVYGSKEGCPFIDSKPNLMNVAMSRAKDRFMVIGDQGCLNKDKKSPSGLLRKYIEDNRESIEINNSDVLYSLRKE